MRVASANSAIFLTALQELRIDKRQQINITSFRVRLFTCKFIDLVTWLGLAQVVF